MLKDRPFQGDVGKIHASKSVLGSAFSSMKAVLRGARGRPGLASLDPPASDGQGSELYRIGSREPQATFPVLIELEFEKTASPFEYGESDDSRQIALGIREVVLNGRVAATGETFKCCIDFADRIAVAKHAVYGVSTPEFWGTWTVGRRCGLLFNLPFDICDLVLEVNARIYSRAFSQLYTSIKTSIGLDGEHIFTNQPASISLRPRSMGPGFDITTMLSAQNSKNNVSTGFESPEISIIILNYKNPNLSALSAIAACNSRISVKFEVIVCDNGSSPEQWDLLSAFGLNARLVRIPTNRYFGEGNNIAIESARGKYVVFINNDAFLENDCLQRLYEALVKGDLVGAVGPSFYYPDGRIQEVGASILENGVAVQRGKNDPSFEISNIQEVDVVDYVSAACIMMRKKDFQSVGGFNYRFDPAYYEDADICFRLKLLNKKVCVVKKAKCIHIENATTGDSMIFYGAHQVVNFNKEIFNSVWGRYLKKREYKNLPNREILPVYIAKTTEKLANFKNAVYSPYPLVPGGGEKYILSSAAALQEIAQTAFVSPHPYSQVRLCNVMTDLAILNNGVIAANEMDLVGLDLDCAILMGNEALPTRTLAARRSFFHCQFPFPTDWDQTKLDESFENLDAFKGVIVNSEFTKLAYSTNLDRYGITKDIFVVYPPAHTAALFNKFVTKEPIILSVGRFAPGGHSKRQDILIRAMKGTSESFRRNWKLVLCGNVQPTPEGRRYFASLKDLAGDNTSIEFCVAPSISEVRDLMLRSAVYASATGFGVSADDVSSLHKVEHFGITVADAISAGCSTVAYEVGGPKEIFDLVGIGTTFKSVNELTNFFESAASNGIEAHFRAKAFSLFNEGQFRQNIQALFA